MFKIVLGAILALAIVFVVALAWIDRDVLSEAQQPGPVADEPSR